MARFGYARVSTEDQSPALQVDALVAAGVPRENVVVERISGAAKVRPLFQALIAKLGEGDTLAVWKVDRLGRSTVDALQTAQQLDKAGVRVVITTLGVDLKTAAGKLVFGVLCQIAEFERELIRERVNAGLKSAKERGKALGRRHILTPHQRKEAAALIEAGKSYGDVAALFGTSRTVVFRSVQKVRAQAAPTQEAA